MCDRADRFLLSLLLSPKLRAVEWEVVVVREGLVVVDDDWSVGGSLNTVLFVARVFKATKVETPETGIEAVAFSHDDIVCWLWFSFCC